MGEAKLHTFNRTFALVSFLLFLVSLETAAKHDKSVVIGGTLTKEGPSFHEWMKPGEDKASKKMIKNIPGYIYLMKTYGASFFKIGQALNPEQRRRNLQSGCPYPLDIQGKWYVKDMNDAEKDVHKQMKSYNRGKSYPGKPWKTEWFEIKKTTPNVISGILTTGKWITALPGGK